ncbi:hypothetical protein BRADI_4g37035v3 [Brachypodium distachyon]|uniref:Uncharacterized protein n=1 Tax=Brachypodium distachyon TaxID=15368 RepID=A0A2K2CSR9_BRADI|nr:hypothetical protein BRADI_4g37035v3 [Brachypodium distachyon]
MPRFSPTIADRSSTTGSPAPGQLPRAFQRNAARPFDRFLRGLSALVQRSLVFIQWSLGWIDRRCKHCRIPAAGRPIMPDLQPSSFFLISYHLRGFESLIFLSRSLLFARSSMSIF